MTEEEGQGTIPELSVRELISIGKWRSNPLGRQ
jgi:hypothetical protein